MSDTTNPHTKGTTQPGSLFCFGLGYSALRLARTAQAAGWQVAGTCRDPARAERLSASGIPAFVFTGQALDPALRQQLAATTHLLDSIPPQEGEDPHDPGDPLLRQCGQTLPDLAPRLSWIGYLSTSGVYGDCQGEWIDEDRPPNPATASNRRRVLTEEAWRALGQRMDVTCDIFRLPGIYGPDGRNPFDGLEAGQARRIHKPGQVFNRIHVDDIAATVLAAMTRLRPGGGIYNVADDEPAAADEVTAHAAALLDIEAPPLVPFEEAGLSPFAQHFYAECKRIRNHRIKHELGVALAYPSYREGLAAILAERQRQTSGHS